jgi:hypothetical protein
MKTMNGLISRTALVLAFFVLIAYGRSANAADRRITKEEAKRNMRAAAPAQASGDESQTTSTNQIEGAFGLRLGEVFDVSKGQFLRNNEYEFQPEGKLGFEASYQVEITPKSHRIAKITVGCLRVNQVEIVVPALASKYGGNPKAGTKYRAQNGSRSVYLQLLGGMCEVVCYADQDVIAAGKREKDELAKAEQAAKQSEVDKKAKALEKSGL